jgi:hypothetical protein
MFCICCCRDAAAQVLLLLLTSCLEVELLPATSTTTPSAKEHVEHLKGVPLKTNHSSSSSRSEA